MPCHHYASVSEPRGMCSYCGEEFPMSKLDSDHCCPTCQRHDDFGDDEELLCVDCNGSGEGQHDGTRCHYCGGKGTV